MNSKGGHRFGQFLIQKNLSRTEMTFSFYAFAPNKSRGRLFTAMVHVRQTRIAAVVGVFRDSAIFVYPCVIFTSGCDAIVFQ